LEEEGLVQIRPQYGTFVSPIRADVVFASKFVREAIECAGVRLAAQRCTAQNAADLRAILARQRAALTEAAFFEADDGMHRLLINIAGQETAWRVLDAAKATLDRVRFLSMMRLTKRQSTVEEHTRICEKVIAHDAAEAAEAMSAHLNGTFASVEYAMQQHPEFFHDQPEDARPSRRRSA
jgi:DNA-binding GntR family transcriptional regulator